MGALLLQPVAALKLAPPALDAWVQTQVIAPDDADEPGTGGDPAHRGVFFGATIAVDGDTAVVGTQLSKHSDFDTPDSDGYDWAYVFHRGPDGVWTQDAKLIPDDARPGDTFAYAVAVDEAAGIVAAGNPQDKAVYVFERDPATGWVQTDVLRQDAKLFGFRVALSGETIVAGGTTGPTFVYDRQEGTWQLTAILEDTASTGGIAGDVMVLRSLPDYWNFAVYERSDGSWARTAELRPGNDDPHVMPGAAAISDDGTTIVIGAGTLDQLWGMDAPLAGIQLTAVGAAWIYERVDGQWIESARLENPEPAPRESFGGSVAVDEGVVAIGADGDIHNGGPQAGAVYVYQKVAGTWALASKLRNTDAGPYGGGDIFGESVAVSAGTVLAGAPFDDSRRDGMPGPLDDDGDIPFCLDPDIMWGCDYGENAGTVYAFEPLGRAASKAVATGLEK